VGIGGLDLCWIRKRRSGIHSLWSERRKGGGYRFSREIVDRGCEGGLA